MSNAPASRRAIAPVESDESPLRHIGLPFFYRHAPTRALGRAAFWLAFLAILGLLFINVLMMPHEQTSMIHALRRFLFGGGGGFATYADGARGICSQFFVIALILSGVVSPLLAAYSLCGERVSGTMEFVRLSPLSTHSIVLGKMFAPAYPLHLISAALLAIALPMGWIGDRDLGSLFTALMCVILGCATLHALGAYLASTTVIARGFGALIGLLGIGFFISFIPFAGWEDRGFEFFAFLSPWSALDGLFWHEFYYRSRYVQTPCLFGLPGAVKFYAFAFHALAIFLLVWAASRKLDAPERPALPWRGWLLLWGFALLTALGISVNFVQRNWGNGCMAAAVVMTFAASGICIVCLLDHPHERDLALADACERLAGREDAAGQEGSPSRLGHALFVTLLTALSSGAVVLFFYLSGRLALTSDLLVVALAIAPMALAFLFALALETAAVGYRSFFGRALAAAVAIGILMACILAPVIHGGVAQSRWWYAMYAAGYSYANPPPGTTLPRIRYYDVELLRKDPEYAPYLQSIKSLEDVGKMRSDFNGAPLKLFWQYHTQSCFVYPLLFLTAVAGLVAWRRRKYAALEAEARAALHGSRPRAAPAPPAIEDEPPEGELSAAAGGGN